MGDEWAQRMVDRLTDVCGTRVQALWKVRLTAQEAPALQSWLASGTATLGALLRNPEDREDPLHAVGLIVLRGRDATLAPADDFVLRPGDEVLFAGWAAARRALSTILLVNGVLEYVLTGYRVPSSWIWRKLRPNPQTATASLGAGSSGRA